MYMLCVKTPLIPLSIRALCADTTDPTVMVEAVSRLTVCAVTCDHSVMVHALSRLIMCTANTDPTVSVHALCAVTIDPTVLTVCAETVS